MVWCTYINRINTISGVSISLHNNFSNLFFYNLTKDPENETHQIKNVLQHFLIIKLMIKEIKKKSTLSKVPVYMIFSF